MSLLGRLIILLSFLFFFSTQIIAQENFKYTTDSFMENDTIYRTVLVLNKLEKIKPHINYLNTIGINYTDIFLLSLNLEGHFATKKKYSIKNKLRLGLLYNTTYRFNNLITNPFDADIDIINFGFALGKTKYFYNKGVESWSLGLEAIAAGNYVTYQRNIEQQFPYSSYTLKENTLFTIVGIGLDYSKILKISNRFYLEITPLTFSYLKSINQSGQNFYNPVYGSFLFRNNNNQFFSDFAFRNNIRIKYCFDIKKKNNN